MNEVLSIAVVAGFVFALCGIGKLLFSMSREIMQEVIDEEDARYKAGFHRGYLEALEKTAKYPMGMLTFTIACANCENFGTDKCADCKAEKESGFIPKETGEDQ